MYAVTICYIGDMNVDLQECNMQCNAKKDGVPRQVTGKHLECNGFVFVDRRLSTV